MIFALFNNIKSRNLRKSVTLLRIEDFSLISDNKEKKVKLQSEALLSPFLGY